MQLFPFFGVFFLGLQCGDDCFSHLWWKRWKLFHHRSLNSVNDFLVSPPIPMWIRKLRLVKPNSSSLHNVISPNFVGRIGVPFLALLLLVDSFPRIWNNVSLPSWVWHARHSHGTARTRGHLFGLQTKLSRSKQPTSSDGTCQGEKSSRLKTAWYMTCATYLVKKSPNHPCSLRHCLPKPINFRFLFSTVLAGRSRSAGLHFHVLKSWRSGQANSSSLALRLVWPQRSPRRWKSTRSPATATG